MRLFPILLIFIFTPLMGQELVMSTKAPAGFTKLKTDILKHNAPIIKDNHGLIEFCYKADSFVVYRQNPLGYGYQLSELKPNNYQCVDPNMVIKSKNELGIYIGMSKSDVQEALGNIELKNTQTLIWQSKLLENEIAFDVQTYSEFNFRNKKLISLSVFTTTTN